MRLAIVQDQLLTNAGSERVALHIANGFPEADIWCLAYNSKSTLPEFRMMGRPIRTTWMNALVRSHKIFKWAFPLATHVMENLDLSAYDVVISSSATVAKYIRAPHAVHVCYCYYPTRALWNTSQYFGGGLRATVMNAFLGPLKQRDVEAAQRVDQFIAISEISRRAIKDIYDRDAVVVPSPIDLERFVNARDEKGAAYLLISRLERWKNLDYAIEAFNDSGRELRVIGLGADKDRLQAMARPNITFVGGVSDATLAIEVRKAKALIFASDLEYGLPPIEANAAGTAVITIARGGVLETMVFDGAGRTAVGFGEPTAHALTEAVVRFEDLTFDETVLRANGVRFSPRSFQKSVKEVVEAACRAKRGSVGASASLDQISLLI
jgi:glycosyltransferase involved in cell wall biosynthesis